MAKPSKKRSAARTGLKWKRKKWFKIAAPKIFNNKVIGEAFAETSQSLLGRTVEVNLMQLTGNIKKQNLVLKMKTNEVKDEIGQTTIMEFYMQPASIKRFVRKGTTKIDESFCCYTRDKVLVRIKPLLLTRTKTNSSVSRDLRKRTRSWLTNTIITLTFENFINDLCLFKIQRDLKTVLDKIYPLKACQIRKAGLETRRKVAILEPTGKEERVERKRFVKRRPDDRRPMRRPTDQRSETVATETKTELKKAVNVVKI